ncbi:DUF3558 domain-containing protein [Amycolatopsis aidingensis]|uniref:DUF3558 domain-containing protein n=1 Tax=Amycolatopsis aidingensis TaxID=2842453 RepID=UPI001C0CB374|nr:DUF3558 domain-containing protein [Amycolatopsis aidingensis]
MQKPVTWLAAAATLLVALGGCSQEEQGSPQPVEPTNNATSAPTNQPGDALASMDACTVLEELLAGQGFGPLESKTARNECGATKIRYGGVGLALAPTQNLAEFAATTPGATSFQINGRDAMEGEGQAGSCLVAMAVGEKARVMTSMNAVGSSGIDECAEARKYAKQLEPMLPKVQ